MNKRSNANLRWLLSIIGSVGIYHADANALEIKDPEQRAAVVRCLVEQGLIIPLEQKNWYQINRERLEVAFLSANKGHRQARHVINLLQSVVSSDVNIREVDILEIQLSTQDYAASSSGK